MARTVKFFFTCPKGHGPVQEYEPEKLRELIDRGELRLACLVCGESWPATAQETQSARELLERGTFGT
jgi:hypothetical protein